MTDIINALADYELVLLCREHRYGEAFTAMLCEVTRAEDLMGALTDDCGDGPMVL